MLIAHASSTTDNASFHGITEQTAQQGTAKSLFSQTVMMLVRTGDGKTMFIECVR